MEENTKNYELINNILDNRQAPTKIEGPQTHTEEQTQYTEDQQTEYTEETQQPETLVKSSKYTTMTESLSDYILRDPYIINPTQLKSKELQEGIDILEKDINIIEEYKKNLFLLQQKSESSLTDQERLDEEDYIQKVEQNAKWYIKAKRILPLYYDVLEKKEEYASQQEKKDEDTQTDTKKINIENIKEILKKYPELEQSIISVLLSEMIKKGNVNNKDIESIKDLYNQRINMYLKFIQFQ